MHPAEALSGFLQGCLATGDAAERLERLLEWKSDLLDQEAVEKAFRKCAGAWRPTLLVERARRHVKLARSTFHHFSGGSELLGITAWASLCLAAGLQDASLAAGAAPELATSLPVFCFRQVLFF